MLLVAATTPVFDHPTTRGTLSGEGKDLLHYKCQARSSDQPTTIPIAHATPVEVQAFPNAITVEPSSSGGSDLTDSRTPTGFFSSLPTTAGESMSLSRKRLGILLLACVLMAGLAAALDCTLRQSCFRREDHDSFQGAQVESDPESGTMTPTRSPATTAVSTSTGGIATPTLHTQSRLQASDASPGDRFGISVSVVGDWMAVGAYRREVGNTTGSVYLYQRTRGVWHEVEQKLVPGSNGALSNMRFGRSVALSRNGATNLVVGAYYDDHAGAFSGSAYIYHREDDGTWVEEAKLTADDASADSLFGVDVAIWDDDMVFVAAKNEENQTGSVYLFERLADGSFAQRQKIRANDAAPRSRFGTSIAVLEDTLVVGSEQGDANEVDSGVVHIFKRSDNGVWVQHQRLLGNDTIIGDLFGFSVAAYNDMIAVGAIGDADCGTNCGSTYIFRRASNGLWAQQQKITGGTSATHAKQFGHSVALNNEHLIIGTQIGVDGSTAGTGYVYQWDPIDDIWTERFTLASEGTEGSDLTPRIAFDGDTVAIGSGYSDTADGRDTGEVFIYRL